MLARRIAGFHAAALQRRVIEKARSAEKKSTGT
jgi:hypothetical protein